MGELDGPPIFSAMFLVQFAAAIYWPWILLPIASPAFAVQDGDAFTAPTVLGVRRIDLATAKVASFDTLSGTDSTRVWLLITRRRFLILMHLHHDSSGLLSAVIGLVVVVPFAAASFFILGGLAYASGIGPALGTATG